VGSAPRFAAPPAIVRQSVPERPRGCAPGPLGACGPPRLGAAPPRLAKKEKGMGLCPRLGERAEPGRRPGEPVGSVSRPRATGRRRPYAGRFAPAPPPVPRKMPHPPRKTPANGQGGASGRPRRPPRGRPDTLRRPRRRPRTTRDPVRGESAQAGRRAGRPGPGRGLSPPDRSAADRRRPWRGDAR